MHLPSLSLESFAATLAPAGHADAAEPPIALLDVHRIAAANAAACAFGVRPGIKRATALALAPQIVLGQADAARDRAALVPVTHCALAYTPMVSLQPGRDGAAPDTVLLEVQASLRCFGGLASLLARLEAAVQPLGHVLSLACAATAQGAAVLSHLRPPPRCTDLAATRQALAEAPIRLLGPGREHWDALQGMGLHVLGDILGLPRSGLARRFGEALLDEIDAALGRRPDPREPIVVPPGFESRLELFARADNTEQVLHGATILLERLIAWLSAQHALVRRFRLVMRHESRWRQSDRTPQATALEVALAEPSRDREHLVMLLRERLARARLPAPTLELCLQAEDIARGAPPNVELFPTTQSEHDGLTKLVERLQARLGSGRVRRLVAVEDHRPERASELVEAEPGGGRAVGRKGRGKGRPPQAGGKVAVVDAAAEFEHASSRPVWLQAPRPLVESASRPLLEGRPLQLLSGPERIESGWWDGNLAGRDYFIAEDKDGALVWIYRDRLPPADGSGPPGWYLQGRFG